MPRNVQRTLFFLFFLSGFCGLLYQVVWLRLAFAAFGVITPVISVVVSVFMMGLAVGSWLAGNGVVQWKRRTRCSAIFLYAIAEFLIGLGAFGVPLSFNWGAELMLPVGEINSASYLFWSAAVIVLSILPWCICMGTTYPLMMEFVRELDTDETTSFSFLYLANVIGAMCGIAVTAGILIELGGFKNTLLFGACANFTVAVISVLLGRRYRDHAEVSEPHQRVNDVEEFSTEATTAGRLTLAILFTTGFCSMALEVIWTRAFTSVLQTQVYSFASLLFTYLLATWVGSLVYRKHVARGKAHSTLILLSLLTSVALLPVLMGDVRITMLLASMRLLNQIIVVGSIFPYCAILGYLTPMLIDEYATGNPKGAGRAYAINVLGSIVGPLAAAYWLLPSLGEKWSMLLLAVPIVALFVLAERAHSQAWSVSRTTTWAAVAGSVIVCLLSSNIEDFAIAKGAEVRRDHTATVISSGSGMQRRMLVNGQSITELTPITKVMAHLPLAYCPQQPESALVICFGMGTTHRSMLSWGIRSTAVELCPSVRDSFPYYFDNAQEIMKNPKGRIAIDDGRRFLKRTSEQFDVITIDPPPPVTAAGSSLLYSVEFYELAKERLKDQGVLQQWFPSGSQITYQAILRSITNAFPHVKVFYGSEGGKLVGRHILASRHPFATLSPEQMIEKMPASARRDLLEWTPEADLKSRVAQILSLEIPEHLLLLNPDESIIVTDDRPFNEYFAWRVFWAGETPLQ